MKNLDTVNCCCKCSFGELDYIPSFILSGLEDSKDTYQREMLLVKCPFDERNYKLPFTLCDHETEKEKIRKCVK